MSCNDCGIGHEAGSAVTTDTNNTLIGGLAGDHDRGAHALVLSDSDGTGEILRVDTSGNLLVGKTSPNSSLTGVQILPEGDELGVTRDGSHALLLNRLTSDGDIALFRKAGTTVGSIGTNSSRLTIGSGDTGLLIAGDLDNITPFNTSTNASRDASVDLGNSGVRFKDLYLSGVMAAGNGSATAPSVRGTDTNTGLFFPSGGVTAITFATVLKPCVSQAQGISTTDKRQALLVM